MSLAYRLEGTALKNRQGEVLPLISKLKLLLPTMDTVALSTHLISSPSLTKWFEQLEQLMRYSLAKSIFDLFDQDDVKRQSSSLQSILLVEHLRFGSTLEEHVKHSSLKNIKFDSRSLFSNEDLSFRYKIEDQLNALINNGKKEENVLIVQRLYFRDVLSSNSSFCSSMFTLRVRVEFIDLGDRLTLNSYEWLSLIKYEVDPTAPTEKKIHLRQFSNRISYQFEFIGKELVGFSNFFSWDLSQDRMR